MSFIQELGLETDDKTALSGLFSDYDTYELWLCFYQPYSYTIAMDYSNWLIVYVLQQNLENV